MKPNFSYRTLPLLFWAVLITPTVFSQKKISLGNKETQQILELHNKERASLGLPALGWDNQIADYASEWASLLAKKDNGIFHRTQRKNNYGENISYFYGKEQDVAVGIQLWLDEKKDYTYSEISALDDQGEKTGHYTQLIWSGTLKIGCGCARGASGTYYLVCNYDPPGNYIGAFPYENKTVTPTQPGQ